MAGCAHLRAPELIMRGAVAAERQGVFAPYVDAVFHHMWEAPKKMDDPEVIAAALTESGLDAERLMAETDDPEVKQALLDNTNKAFEQGAFGSPSFGPNKFTAPASP